MAEIIGIALTLFVGLFILIGLLIGLARRTYRSLIRMGTIIIAAVLAALISNPIASAVCRGLSDLLNEVTSELASSFGNVLTQSSALADLVAALPTIAVSLLIYGPVFVILSLLMLIPYAIICNKVLKKKPAAEAVSTEAVVETVPAEKKPEKKSKNDFPCDRLVGMLVGGVAGLLVCSFLFAPVCGLIGFADRTVRESFYSTDSSINGGQTDGELSVRDLEQIGDFSVSIANHWFVKMTNLYSDLILNPLTRVTVSGRSVSVMAELNNLSASLTEVMKALPQDGEELSLESLPAFLNAAADSELLCTVAADTLKSAVLAWSNGEKFMDIEFPGDEGPTGELLLEVLSVLGESTPENISADLKTVGKVLDILADRGILEALGDGAEEFDFMTVLEDSTFMDDLLGTVLENDHMKSLVPVFMNFGLSTLGETLSLPESASDLYEKMTADLAAALNAKPSEKEFTDRAVEIVKESGCEVSDEVTKLLAKGLYASYKNENFVTAEQVADFFGDVFEDKSVSSDNPFVFASSEIADQIRAQIALLDETVRAGAEKLKSSKTFETTKITIEDIKIDPDKLSALSTEELKQEVSVLSGAVSSAVKFVSTLSEEGGEINLASLDMKALGNAVDGLMSSKLLGDSASDVLMAVLESPDVQEILPNAKETLGETLIEGSKKGEVKFEDVFETAQKVASLLDLMQNNVLPEEERNARLTETVKWLLDNMSQKTADSLKSVFTADMLKTLGVEGRQAEAISTTVGIMLDEMVACSNLSETEYKKESDSIMAMLRMAIQSDEADENKAIATILQSKVAMTTMKKAVDKLGFDPLGIKSDMTDNAYKSYADDMKKTMKEIVDEQYASASDKTLFKQSMIALGNFLGVDLEKSVNDWTK